MAVSFDGANLIITLESGITSLGVQDIYEDWKEWVKLSDNSKYIPAFRPDGGAPLSGIINQGSYFFLNNAEGWRIKPPEEDITIYLTGNLAVEDTDQPAFIATTGAFTAAILGLQPVTQGVTPVMADQLAFASYSGPSGPGIWVDAINGTPGTGNLANSAPRGTAENPSSNVQDAVIIAAAKGLPKTIYIIGDLTLGAGDDLTGYRIEGQNEARTMLTISTAATVANAEVIGCTLTGTLDGNALIRNCHIAALDYFSGFIFQCGIEGPITLGGAAQADLLDCYSNVPGTSAPVIDCGGSGQSLSLRSYAGGIKLTNKTGADASSVDLQSGQVRLDLTTVTNGSLVVRGDGKCVDDADPTDHLLSGTYGSLTLINETTSGQMVQEIWQRLGLDPDAPMTTTPTEITFGGKTITLSGDGITSSTATRQP